MTKAILTFSNGETLELAEGQMIIPIVSYISEGEKRLHHSISQKKYGITRTTL